MDLGLRGKTVIVTGGSGGIGTGVVNVFAEEGANVVIADLREADKEMTTSLEEKYNVGIMSVICDCGKEEDIVSLFQKAIERFGTVDCLINNAAYMGKPAVACPITEFKVEDYRISEKVNDEGMMLMCREFVKECYAKDHPGSIVNVLTKSSFLTSSKNNCQYATSKGASAMFVRNLAHEVAPRNIRVNGIIPGYVVFEGAGNNERLEKIKQIVPNGIPGTPREMANMIAFLCSDKASQTNGAWVDCSGGTMAGV